MRTRSQPTFLSTHNVEAAHYLNLAELQSTNDYYPFGSQLPGRGFDVGSYKFGFNGKEQDDEIHGNANAYDFGERIYDTRIGRWMSADRLEKIYPSSSPYRFSKDCPMLFVDIDGTFDFRISDAAAKHYNLTKQDCVRFEYILNNCRAYLIDNPDVLKTISLETGISQDDILKDSEFGKGPVIMFDYTPQTQLNGANVSESDAIINQMPIDASIVKNFEKMKFKNDDEKVGYTMAMVGLLFHEYTHLKDRQKNGRITGQTKADRGLQGYPSVNLHRGIDVEVIMYLVVRSATVSTEADESKNWNVCSPKDAANISRNLKVGNRYEKSKKRLTQ